MNHFEIFRDQSANVARVSATDMGPTPVAPRWCLKRSQGVFATKNRTQRIGKASRSKPRAPSVICDLSHRAGRVSFLLVHAYLPYFYTRKPNVGSARALLQLSGQQTPKPRHDNGGSSGGFSSHSPSPKTPAYWASDRIRELKLCLCPMCLVWLCEDEDRDRPGRDLSPEGKP
jgi:hypothetical protein